MGSTFLSFEQLLAEAQKRQLQQAKEYMANNRLCLNCGQHPGDPTSDLNKYHCAACNKETQDLIDSLI